MGVCSYCVSIYRQFRSFSHFWLVGMICSTLQLVEKHRKLRDKSAFEEKPGSKCVAIVTGGSKGIGLQIVRQLLSRGFHTIVISRSNENLDKLKTEFPSENVEHLQADMSSLRSIRDAANNFLDRNLPLHVLINNAGIMVCPYKLTEDGIESQLSTNYLGHFLLAYLLLPRLKKTGLESLRSRIVNVSSFEHFASRAKIDDFSSKKYYSSYGSYAQSKLYQVMHAILLQDLLNKRGDFVTINSVHPGAINTDLHQNMIYGGLGFLTKLLFKSAKQGADGIIYVALAKDIEGIGGKYFDNCKIKKPSKLAGRRELQLELWRKTCDVLKINDFDLQFSKL